MCETIDHETYHTKDLFTADPSHEYLHNIVSFYQNTIGPTHSLIAPIHDSRLIQVPTKSRFANKFWN